MRVAISTLFILMAALGASQSADAHQRGWPGKRLAEAMPEAKQFSQKQMSLSSSQVGWVEKNLGGPIGTEDKTPAFYVGTDAGGRSIGVVFFLDTAGTNGKIEIGLAMKPDGSVVRVVLYEQSESASVASSGFLGQFAGKTAVDKLKVGADVTAPKGDEKIAQIIATATRRGLLLATAGLRLGVK